MSHLIQAGTWDFGGLVVEVGEDVQTRLTALTVTLPTGQVLRAYFNGLGAAVSLPERDGLAAMLAECHISPGALEPLSPDRPEK